MIHRFSSRFSLGKPDLEASQGSPFFSIWVWLKIKQEGQTAGFGPCFHLPGPAILVFRFFEPQPYLPRRHVEFLARAQPARHGP